VDGRCDKEDSLDCIGGEGSSCGGIDCFHCVLRGTWSLWVISSRSCHGFVGGDRRQRVGMRRMSEMVRASLSSLQSLSSNVNMRFQGRYSSSRSLSLARARICRGGGQARG
jgi:hypothetical protein